MMMLLLIRKVIPLLLVTMMLLKKQNLIQDSCPFLKKMIHSSLHGVENPMLSTMRMFLSKKKNTFLFILNHISLMRKVISLLLVMMMLLKKQNLIQDSCPFLKKMIHSLLHGVRNPMLSTMRMFLSKKKNTFLFIRNHISLM
ncbi:hypothetical protein RYX36_037335, partial [Vicia faba]